MRITNLEDLSNHLLDQWNAGHYTAGESLLSGRKMAEIYICKAHDIGCFEEAEVMWNAEQIEEWIEDTMNKWR